MPFLLTFLATSQDDLINKLGLLIAIVLVEVIRELRGHGRVRRIERLENLHLDGKCNGYQPNAAPANPKLGAN
jgi:Na+-transporting NADH:ubiquinone oxidoreductase subunit NqrD